MVKWDVLRPWPRAICEAKICLHAFGLARPSTGDNDAERPMICLPELLGDSPPKSNRNAED